MSLSLLEALDPADRYDRNVTTYNYDPERLSELALHHLEPRSKILDVACGTGLAGIPFIKAGHDLAGADLSLEKLKRALERGYSSAIRMLAEEWCINHEYDAVISSGSIGELIDYNLAIPEMARSVKQNGVLAFTTHVSRTDESSLRSMLDFYGFSLLEFRKEVEWKKGGKTCYSYYVVARRS